MGRRLRLSSSTYGATMTNVIARQLLLSQHRMPPALEGVAKVVQIGRSAFRYSTTQALLLTPVIPRGDGTRSWGCGGIGPKPSRWRPEQLLGPLMDDRQSGSHLGSQPSGKQWTQRDNVEWSAAKPNRMLSDSPLGRPAVTRNQQVLVVGLIPWPR
jgi:hypothetical protein